MSGGFAAPDAIIIAGGKGERLRPFTDLMPKCLVEVGGRPILEWQLSSLERAGVRRVAIVTHYLFDRVQEFVARRAGTIEARVAVEAEKLGRGGAIKLGSRVLGLPDAVLALNGDIITHASLLLLEAARLRLGAAAAVLAVPLRSPYGVLDIEESRIVRFREKPVLRQWINGGIYALSASAVARFPDVGDHEDTAFPELARLGDLAAVRFRGPWCAVDSPKDIREAESIVSCMEPGCVPVR